VTRTTIALLVVGVICVVAGMGLWLGDAAAVLTAGVLSIVAAVLNYEIGPKQTPEDGA